jgi:threonine synthase
MSYYIDLKCSKCGDHHSGRKIQNSCSCGGQLLVTYDLAAITRAVSKDEISGRPFNMWRYVEMLPVENEKNIITLQEGGTPILSLDALSQTIGHPSIYLKDEGRLPTGTFKARGASVGISKAKELGIRTVAIPTAGNAGGAWATYGARAKIEVYVVMPSDARNLCKLETIALGAHVYLVKGLISEAGDIVSDACKKYGWFSISTFNEPYRLEGKKTLGLEIAEQFGWSFPEVILYPCGGGVGLVGIWKAYKELKEMGWVDGPGPRMVAVQSDGCAPVVKSFLDGSTTCEKWVNVQTIVDGLRVPKPLADTLILKTIRESNGCAIAVREDDIPNAMINLARKEGILACPEGASTLLALESLVSSNWIKKSDCVLLLNTGSGLKYTEFIKESPYLLEKGEFIAEEVEKYQPTIIID